MIVVAVTVLAVIIAGIFLIGSKEPTTDVTKDSKIVGIVLNGSVADHSWGQSHYEGLLKSAEELNLRILYREKVANTEECFDAIQELINEGSEIIICNSFGFGEWELRAAKENPDLFFFHAAGLEGYTNMATFFGRIYQMRYLSGIVAGLQTETDEIGYVAAFPISEVNRGLNAFTLGVRSVNPDATVYVNFCNSWDDDEAVGDSAYALLDRHKIDVLAMHTDSLRALEIAEEKGIWSIGYNIDNCELFPNTYLTAPIWRWENFYTPHILECLQGKFEGIHYWEGADTGVVSLAPLTDNVKPGVAEAVEKEMKRLQDRVFDVFYGPVLDRDGRVRIEEGESMSDDSMLNEFDWYVEGVVLDEMEEKHSME